MLVAMAARSRRALSLWLAAAIVAATALPASDAAADPKARDRKYRVAAIGAAILLFVASETVAKDALSPDRCRWCTPGNFDDGARELAVWADPDRAARLSNLIGYGLAPIAASGLLLAASARTRPGWWTADGDDMIAMFEIVWGVQLVTQAVKITAARERPYANYGADVDERAQEQNLSFFSGHSSLTFSLAVGSGIIAERRGSRLAPVIWASGLAIAATTGYLRMAADRHYATDVLTGAAAGALGAVLIPRLTGSLSSRATLVPQPGGLALVGRF
jgi:membrane-associated phospholipid phosphatase